MNIAHLDDRALVKIAGADAEHFLENLITCKIEGLDTGGMNFGALLTPQGKIMFDFFVSRDEKGFLIDIDKALELEFIKRMTFYKLRAKVEISRVQSKKVFACWGEGLSNGKRDPRMPAMGNRVYHSNPLDGSSADYHKHRISCGVPQGDIDFAYGDAYPHEVLMDQSGGVDFKKGCFVGQEVVSRMQHRGTTKKRVVHISADAALPDTGTEIKADGKPAGKIGSISGRDGLALLRLDRVARAEKVLANDVELKVTVQGWVNFSMPVVAENTADG